MAALSQFHDLVRHAQQRNAMETEPASDFVEGFRHFRQSHNQHAGSSRTKKLTPMYAIHVVCLDGPGYSTVHPGIIRKMNSKGLGNRKLKIKRTSSTNAFLRKISQEFKLSCGIKIMRAVKADSIYSLVEIESSSIGDIKAETSRSKIYILPDEEINERMSSSDDEDSTVTPSEEVLPSLRRPQRQQRSSHVRALAVIANATADLMEHSDDEELPDPAINETASPNHIGRHRAERSPRARRSGTNTNNYPSITRGSRGPRRNLSLRGGRSNVNSRRNQDRPTNTGSSLQQARGQATPTNTGSSVQQARGQATPTNTGTENITEQIFVPTGTPSIDFRHSTPVPQERGLMNINTADVISLDDTKEMNISEIADFIPDVLPTAENRTQTNVNEIKDTIRQHRKDFISEDIDNSLLMEVRRDHVLNDALSYIRCSDEDLNRPLHITFMGEDGVDLGGLRREFWSIFVHQVGHSVYVSGKSGSLSFRRNYMETKKKTFHYLGKLVALSILEDGPGLPIFSEAVTDYILEGRVKNLNITDLPDHVRDKLDEMDSCSSDDKLQDLYADLNEEVLAVHFLVPGFRFHKELLPSLKSAFIENQVNSCKEELDQFITGLETHQVIHLLRLDDNKVKARVLFSGLVKPITVMSLRSLMKFNYSEGNKRLAEMATTQGFIAFLQAASVKTSSKACVNGITITLEDILMWLTGARQIPAAGFHKKIDVDFKSVVSVNTCALALSLKVHENMSTDEAVKHYSELLINSQTFTME